MEDVTDLLTRPFKSLLDAFANFFCLCCGFRHAISYIPLLSLSFLPELRCSGQFPSLDMVGQQSLNMRSGLWEGYKLAKWFSGI